MWWIIFISLPFLEIEAAKYHQNDYNTELTRVQVVDYNRSYFSYFNCSLVYYNRTYRALNFSAHLIKDIGMNLKVQFQVLKFLSNEYRFFPITLEIDGCKELQRDTYGIQESYQKAVNFDFHCPIKKGVLNMKYGMIDYSKLPPYIPSGEYKAEINFFDGSNYIHECDYYGKVEVKKKINF